MVQDPSALVPFFQSHIAKNSEHNAIWGEAYRQLVEQVQQEKPDFSDDTIRQIWYDRNNGVSSLMQGGMSWAEFEGAKEQLRDLTRMMAEGCTREVYDRAISQLVTLKTEKILAKKYLALCHRAFAALYPYQITSVVNISYFWGIYNYCINRFNPGLTNKGDWFDRNLELTDALQNMLGNNTDPIELNMSLWHLHEEYIIAQGDSSLIAAEKGTQDDEMEASVSTPQLAKNTILYGPPGTGKTYHTIDLAVEACEPEAYLRQTGKDPHEKRRELKAIYDRLVDKENSQVRFITFHQSFGYEEFIEGLSATTSDAGEVVYSIKKGIFTQICEDAASDKDKNYVLIIDEINRGNVSKIFGELITLIESSKRAGEPEALSVKLPYSSSDFSVPNNLYLIGTMNTADRSLTALDTALRRRFEFKAMLPDLSVLQKTVVNEIDVQRLLKTLNDRIEVLYDREHMLGHSYFLPVVQAKENSEQAFKILKNIMRNRVLPLLEEYFYNDWQKIRMVLGDNQKEESLQFIREVKNQKQFSDLFGKNGTEDLQESGTRFLLADENDNVWDNPLAWQQIYALRTGNEA